MKRLKVWLPSLLWMGFIFLMSATPGDVSGEESGLIVALLMRALRVVLGDGAGAVAMPSLHILVRKGAHMTEYAVLFLLCRRSLRQSGAAHAGRAAFALCIAYAATDEFHQRFVPGREGCPADVLIDAAGAILAWGASLCLSRRSRSRL